MNEESRQLVRKIRKSISQSISFASDVMDAVDMLEHELIAKDALIEELTMERERCRDECTKLRAQLFEIEEAAPETVRVYRKQRARR